MIIKSDRNIEALYYSDQYGIPHEIITVYFRGREVYEVIIGFLFTKDGFSLQSKDGFILKAKDQ